jgi:hypothetical protein
LIWLGCCLVVVWFLLGFCLVCAWLLPVFDICFCLARLDAPTPPDFSKSSQGAQQKAEPTVFMLQSEVTVKNHHQAIAALAPPHHEPPVLGPINGEWAQEAVRDGRSSSTSLDSASRLLASLDSVQISSHSVSTEPEVMWHMRPNGAASYLRPPTPTDSTPSSNFPTLAHGEEIRTLERDDSWVCVATKQGDRGWVRARYLRSAPLPSGPPPCQPTERARPAPGVGANMVPRKLIIRWRTYSGRRDVFSLRKLNS